MLIAISISALVVGTLVAAYLAGAGLFRSEVNISSIQLEAGRAVNTMSKEIANCLEVESASQTSLSVWLKDLNSNGTKEASETVTYFWDGTSGGNLMRTLSSNSQILSKYVKNFMLTYDNPSISQIKMVTISLTNSQGGEISTLESSIRIRNL